MDIQENLSSWKFHHLGVACRDIDREFSAWADLGYFKEGDSFDDLTQGIRGLFLTGPGPRLELLQDLPERYTVAPWLEKGVKIYHTAYVVRNLDAEIAQLLRARARVVVEPVKAIAFQNRRICFLMLKNLSLIELIDAI